MVYCFEMAFRKFTVEIRAEEKSTAPTYQVAWLGGWRHRLLSYVFLPYLC